MVFWSLIYWWLAHERNSSPTIVNSILWSNNALTGDEIWIGDILYPASLTISYSNVMGGQPNVYIAPGSVMSWGSGMIDSDPLFQDPNNDDYHLTVNSPCIDVGNNLDVPAGITTDFEGDDRIIDGDGDTIAVVDMGADEYKEPTAVTLISFKATGKYRQVAIKWKTACELNNAGFNIWRCDKRGGVFRKINDLIIMAKGGPTAGAEYSFADTTAIFGQEYYYRLEDIEFTGKSKFHRSVKLVWSRNR